MKALSLFSGIGGLDLATEAAGIETIAMCEIDPFCRSILALRFPGLPIAEDVRVIQGNEFEGVDVIYGGFPCQDLSSAGPQKGLEGERSRLWFEMLRIIGNARPCYVIAENVYNAIHLALDRIIDGLEGESYKVWPVVLPASAFGAPHERKRLCVLAIRNDVADACGERLQGSEWSRTLCEQEPPAPESASKCGCYGGLWSTPKASDAIIGATARTSGRSLEKTTHLTAQVHLWPTPTVFGNHNRRGLSSSSGDGLSTSVKMWTTPAASDSQSLNAGGRRGSLRSNLHNMYGIERGSLNPDWVECLMGYPLGWTDPECKIPGSWPGWPKGKGTEQFDYEPPRLTDRREHRTDRIKALGNAVVRQQFEPVFRAVRIIDEAVKTGG